MDEAQAPGIETTMHHAQIASHRANVLYTSGWGVDSMEHRWYGLPIRDGDDALRVSWLEITSARLDGTVILVLVAWASLTSISMQSAGQGRGSKAAG